MRGLIHRSVTYLSGAHVFFLVLAHGEGREVTRASVAGDSEGSLPPPSMKLKQQREKKKESELLGTEAYTMHLNFNLGSNVAKNREGSLEKARLSWLRGRSDSPLSGFITLKASRGRDACDCDGDDAVVWGDGEVVRGDVWEGFGPDVVPSARFGRDDAPRVRTKLRKSRTTRVVSFVSKHVRSVRSHECACASVACRFICRCVRHERRKRGLALGFGCFRAGRGASSAGRRIFSSAVHAHIPAPTETGPTQRHTQSHERACAWGHHGCRLVVMETGVR